MAHARAANTEDERIALIDGARGVRSAIAAEVRQTALALFRTRFGVSWSARFERRLQFPEVERVGAEQKAYRLLTSLRSSVASAFDFAKRESGRGVAGSKARARLLTLVADLPHLLHAVDRAVAGLTPVRRDQDRVRLAARLDKTNVFDLPARPDGAAHFLTHRDMAIVSLLLGYRGLRAEEGTAADIIAREEEAMKKALAEARKQRARHATIVRGPVRGRTSYPSRGKLRLA